MSNRLRRNTIILHNIPLEGAESRDERAVYTAKRKLAAHFIRDVMSVKGTGPGDTVLSNELTASPWAHPTVRGPAPPNTCKTRPHTRQKHYP